MNKGIPESNEAHEDRAKREASDWVIKQFRGFSPEEQDSFFEWLAADPYHAECYSSRQKAWEKLNVLAEWRPEHSRKPNPDLLEDTPPTKRFAKKIIRLASGLAACLALGFVLWSLSSEGEIGPPSILVTGEIASRYERHVLEDGSIIEMNKGAQASVDFTDDSRNVILESGEAHFTIAKETGRPFVVMAQGVAIQAVGTIFNVQIHANTVDVLVTEGRVKLAPVDSKKSILEGDTPLSVFQELTAGQRSVVDISQPVITPLIEEVSSVEVEKQLSWLNQVLKFNQTPLAEIVSEFNRLNYKKIVIADAAMEEKRVTATIRPENVDGFIELLELTMNLQAEKVDESIILLRSKE